MTIPEKIQALLSKKRGEARANSEIHKLRAKRETQLRQEVLEMLESELGDWFEVIPYGDSLRAIAGLKISAYFLVRMHTPYNFSANVWLTLTFIEGSHIEEYAEILFKEIFPLDGEAIVKVMGTGITAGIALEDFRENIARWIVEQL